MLWPRCRDGGEALRERCRWPCLARSGVGDRGLRPPCRLPRVRGDGGSVLP